MNARSFRFHAQTFEIREWSLGRERHDISDRDPCSRAGGGRKNPHRFSFRWPVT